MSVCHAAPSNRFFFLISRWNRAIFCLSVLCVALYKTFFFDFWFMPPNARNLLPKICACTKSPITRLVCQIDRSCLVLSGETTRGPILVAMATTFALGAESIAYRLVCLIVGQFVRPVIFILLHGYCLLPVDIGSVLTLSRTYKRLNSRQR